MNSAIKAYPCIGTAQTMVAGVLQARAGVADPAREVQRIEVVMADIPIVSSQVADEQRRYPASRESADHSFYFLRQQRFRTAKFLKRSSRLGAGCSAK